MKNGVFRAFKTPTNPQTTSQMNVRAEFTINTQAWNALTEPQRLAWEASAQSGKWTKADPFTGTTREISVGKQLYMFVNQNIVQVGGSPVSAPPDTEDSGDTVATGATVVAGAGTFTVAYTGTLGANEVHLFTATPAINAGNMRLRRAIARAIANNTTSSPASVATGWTNIYGVLTGTAGKKIFVVVEAVNQITGQRRVVGIVNDVVA